MQIENWEVEYVKQPNELNLGEKIFDVYLVTFHSLAEDRTFPVSMTIIKDHTPEFLTEAITKQIGLLESLMLKEKEIVSPVAPQILPEIHKKEE
jgi:hypothetical protein